MDGFYYYNTVTGQSVLPAGTKLVLVAEEATTDSEARKAAEQHDRLLREHASVYIQKSSTYLCSGERGSGSLQQFYIVGR